jgi:hypothetical protein
LDEKRFVRKTYQKDYDFEIISPNGLRKSHQEENVDTNKRSLRVNS